jgi:peptide methionine sulfoxide reductase MsrA
MSAIFYHTPEQKKIAEESMKVIQSRQARPIQTKILPATEFTEAEE